MTRFRPIPPGLAPLLSLLLSLCSLAWTGPALAGSPEGAEALRARLEALAGRPVALDPRLVFPPCPGPHAVELRDTPGRSLVVACPPLGRRLLLPVASATAIPALRSAPLVRRGDRVAVLVEGDGFRVSTEALAETGGGAGERITLRNLESGRRFSGRVRPDGLVAVEPSSSQALP